MVAWKISNCPISHIFFFFFCITGWWEVGHWAFVKQKGKGNLCLKWLCGSVTASQDSKYENQKTILGGAGITVKAMTMPVISVPLPSQGRREKTPSGDGEEKRKERKGGEQCEENSKGFLDRTHQSRTRWTELQDSSSTPWQSSSIICSKGWLEVTTGLSQRHE